MTNLIATFNSRRHRLDTRAALNGSRVPEGLHGGLVRWLHDGVPPGDFLRAVLENDLKGACERADLHNRGRLFDIVDFLYNWAPGAAWGSPEKVAAWAEQGTELTEIRKRIEPRHSGLPLEDEP